MVLYAEVGLVGVSTRAESVKRDGGVPVDDPERGETDDEVEPIHLNSNPLRPTVARTSGRAAHVLLSSLRFMNPCRNTPPIPAVNAQIDDRHQKGGSWRTAPAPTSPPFNGASSSCVPVGLILFVTNKVFDSLHSLSLIGAPVDVVVRGEASAMASLGISDPVHQLAGLVIASLIIWGAESAFQYAYDVAWRTIAQTVQHDHS